MNALRAVLAMLASLWHGLVLAGVAEAGARPDTLDLEEE